jgi:hypothetical protein
MTTTTQIDINRLAQRMLEEHGHAAVAKARENVEEARQKGDEQAADIWLSVLVELGTPGGPASPPRH